MISPRLALLLVSLAAAACGQTGSLYLPGAAGPTDPVPASEQADTGNDTQEDDEDAR